MSVNSGGGQPPDKDDLECAMDVSRPDHPASPVPDLPASPVEEFRGFQNPNSQISTVNDSDTVSGKNVDTGPKMDIRKFFNKPNKRLKIDDGSDISNSTENSSIVCSQNDLAVAGPSSLESAVSASQRETNVVTATASDNFAIVEDSLNLDVGNYLDTNKICSLNDRLKFTLLTNPWKPDKCYNFKYDIDDGKRPFIHEWLNTYPWLAYSKEVKDFLGFTPLKSLDAEHIANAITLTLTNWGLNLENAVGQGYDGCSTMAGEITGVHKRITEKYPKALYFHCASHRLNLVVNDLNDIPQIRNTTGTVKEVITFFRQNGQRRAIVGTLQKLCETRWTEKYKAIRKFSEQFVSIAEALQTLSTEGNRDTRQKAFQLHCAVTNTAFVICLHVIAKYSAKLEIVTQMLQGVSVDILKISKHIQKVTELFSSDRQNGEKEFDNIMANVETTANKLGIELTCPRVAARQVHRPNHSTQTINEYYRKSIFLPYLDSLVQSLKDRFSDRNKPSFEIFNLHPKIMKDLSKEDFEKSINNINSTYCELLDNFKEQSILWFDLWKNTEIDAKALEKLNLIEVLEHEHACFLPSVAKAIQIALCLPPTTCTIERSFSTLKRVKTWIRNTMSNNRLSGLCLLSVHRRKIKENIENFMQKVIDLFAMDTRRIQLLFK
ncbi:52 kDa repressor of the inhibitor of the protein kinase-like [Diabrotica virgifera virgifera]|uniref:HAT C-terminal dimerisation domain-containing protein n=2 Tax=Diabrotica virgifera virgifera TaxID=50390 RepID=A0ABM5KY56_DIAVI|nr:52 kDa repressor of the inhibitor of the protein kinase-like [Diabrotica virgifera virgifera]